MSRVASPTIVLGLGTFGCEVVERLRPLSDARTILLEADAARPAAEHVARAVESAESLLGLSGLIESRAPGDDRRPALDLFVVADLGEPEVAEGVPELVRELGQRLEKRFSHIFGGHDQPNLTLSPVLALTGSRSGQSTAGAARALGRIEAEAFAGGPAGAEVPPPVPRVFVVEQQTSRYELSQAELTSTVVSFLSLLLRSSLRQEEPIRGFLRGPPEQLRDRRVFASFGCATLELCLQRYCVAQGAADLVERMREVPSTGAAAGAARAHRLVPAAADLESSIQKHDSGGDLIELLRAQAPHVDYPGIDWHHTPEQIRDLSYGWGWYEALESNVDSLVRRLDDSEMDELSRVADERGQALSRRLLDDARSAVRELERSGPHGWAAALRLAEQLHARAERETRSLEKQLRGERLPPFPKPDSVEAAFRALREESTLRPRPVRLWVFGALGALVAAGLLSFLPKWVLVALLWRRVPLATLEPSASSVAVTGPVAYLVELPWVFAWLLIAIGAGLGLWLSRYRKQRHQALLAARDALEAAVTRFLTDAVAPSILGYYEARLRFVMRAWALRGLSRLKDAASREIDRLTGISAALARLSRELGAEARRMEAERSGGEGGDLLYRTRVSPELLTSTYRAVRPAADLAQRLFERSLADTGAGEGEVPAYLLPENLVAVVEPHVQPPGSVLEEHAGPSVVEFVRELSGKLGVPLEIRGFDESSAERSYLFAPEWAMGPLAAARDELRSLPEPLPHADADRVHLVTVRTALTRSSIVVLAEAAS